MRFELPGRRAPRGPEAPRGAHHGRPRDRIRRANRGDRHPVELRLTHTEDLRDGRHVLEFARPSVDLILYHDLGVTIAEWVTMHGVLIALIPVGEA